MQGRVGGVELHVEPIFFNVGLVSRFPLRIYMCLDSFCL